MEYGHLHQVILERRDGGEFVTFDYRPDFRANCGRSGNRSPFVPTLLRTNIAATRAIVLAFNEGNVYFLRGDETARDVRLALFAFLKAADPADWRWAVISEDLHSLAAIPLCAV